MDREPPNRGYQGWKNPPHTRPSAVVLIPQAKLLKTDIIIYGKAYQIEDGRADAAEGEGDVDHARGPDH
jgi:hypothetical protein